MPRVAPRTMASIEPAALICYKTSSIRLEGAVTDASFIDEEVATLPEDTLYEQEQACKESYVAYWCQLSQLDLTTVTADSLNETDGVPLFRLDRWESSLIPQFLRRPTDGKVEATAVPLTYSDVTVVSSWLNTIMASFKRPVPLASATPSIPEGWREGIYHTREASKTTHPVRSWSSHYSPKLWEGVYRAIQPGIVFCGQLDPETGFAWRHVLSFLELTSSDWGAQTQIDLTRKAYAVFMSQPTRRFVVALSIARQEFRLHILDRSGAVHSLGHDIHEDADLLTCVLYVLAFGSPAALGFDPTFEDPTLSPVLLYRPQRSSIANLSRKIYVGDRPYLVIRCMTFSGFVRGRGTTSWLVKRNKQIYVIKDYWTIKEQKATEEDMLERIRGVLGVPQLVEAWTVQANGTDQTTDVLRPEFLLGNGSFNTRIHRRLVMTPVGHPIVNFFCLKELVSTFIDIVQIHFNLVTVHSILHCDISFHNILASDCEGSPWPAETEEQKKREKIIASNQFRRGLLIDFDQASPIDREKQGVVGNDCTGTLPFMAIDLLKQQAWPTDHFVHKASHDLESLIYVLVWICVLYQGPGEVRSDRPIEQTCLHWWTSTEAIPSLYSLKVGQLILTDIFLDDFTPYFEPLKSTVSRLYDLMIRSRDDLVLNRPNETRAVLDHTAVTEILMEAFDRVPVESTVPCGAVNEKRKWERMRREGLYGGSTPDGYDSEPDTGRNVRRRA